MSNDVSTDSWFQDYAEGHDELQVEEYDITATPNDFNVMTLCSFMDSGFPSSSCMNRSATSFSL